MNWRRLMLDMGFPPRLAATNPSELTASQVSASSVLCSTHGQAFLYRTRYQEPRQVGTGRGSDPRLRGVVGGVAEGHSNHIAAPMLRRNKASEKY